VRCVVFLSCQLSSLDTWIATVNTRVLFSCFRMNAGALLSHTVKSSCSFLTTAVDGSASSRATEDVARTTADRAEEDRTAEAAPGPRAKANRTAKSQFTLLTCSKCRECVFCALFIVAAVKLNQWFLNFTNAWNPYVVFQAFIEPHFCPIQQKVKMGKWVKSFEPSLRTTELNVASRE